MENSSIVDFRQVSFSYNGMVILENVNLTVKKYDLTSIVGPNGGGKTTFLKLMLGLLKPTSGEIKIFGENPQNVRNRIGYMPQYMNFDSRFPITVLETVLMGRLERRWGGPYSKGDKQKALMALEKVGLGEVSKKLFSELSGGQRQRVLIARAIVGEPELLLLDEPTANIDALVEAKLFEFLGELNKNMTILMVSHDLGFVSDIVKHVICVNKKVQLHPTSEITHDLINRLYGEEVRIIRHDHDCIEKGHTHD